MANSKQAKKRALQNDRKRDSNRSVRTETRSVVRSVRAVAETDAKKAADALPGAASVLDVAVRKGVLHKKTASRLKSRLAKRVSSASVAKA